MFDLQKCIMAIAKKHKQTPEHIEHEMQIFLDALWNHPSCELKTSGVFGDKKPTLAEFMEKIINDIRIEIQKEQQIGFWTRHNRRK